MHSTQLLPQCTMLLQPPCFRNLAEAKCLSANFANAACTPPIALYTYVVCPSHFAQCPVTAHTDTTHCTQLLHSQIPSAMATTTRVLHPWLPTVWGIGLRLSVQCIFFLSLLMPCSVSVSPLLPPQLCTLPLAPATNLHLTCGHHHTSGDLSQD